MSGHSVLAIKNNNNKKAIMQRFPVSCKQTRDRFKGYKIVTHVQTAHELQMQTDLSMVSKCNLPV